MTTLPFHSDTSILRRIRAVQSGTIVYACGIRLPIISTTTKKD